MRWVAVGTLVAIGFAIDIAWLLALLDHYGIPIGPFVTQIVWLAVWFVCALRRERCPIARVASWYEVAPAVIAAVFVQLLLDMRAPYLGDAIIGAVHAIAAGVLVACNRRSPPA